MLSVCAGAVLRLRARVLGNHRRGHEGPDPGAQLHPRPEEGPVHQGAPLLWTQHSSMLLALVNFGQPAADTNTGVSLACVCIFACCESCNESLFRQQFERSANSARFQSAQQGRVLLLKVGSCPVLTSRCLATRRRCSARCCAWAASRRRSRTCPSATRCEPCVMRGNVDRAVVSCEWHEDVVAAAAAHAFILVIAHIESGLASCYTV